MICRSAQHLKAAISILVALFFAVGLAVATATPASARVDVSVGFNVGGVNFGYFHNDLRRHGRWRVHPIWGDVWQPPGACRYRPYFNGHFSYTSQGMLWVGFDPWSDVTDHYGRWARDPRLCVVWVPGYVWSPAWVIFRQGGGYIGWFPMPPNYGDFDDGPYFGVNVGWNDWYGYRDWYGRDSDVFFNLWIFVDDNHFYRRDSRNFYVDSSRVRNLIERTQDTTHYAMENDRMVNRSIPVDRLERITGKRIEPMPVERLLKRKVPMAPVSVGRGHAREEGSGERGPRIHDRENKVIKDPAAKERVLKGARERPDMHDETAPTEDRGLKGRRGGEESLQGPDREERGIKGSRQRGKKATEPDAETPQGRRGGGDNEEPRARNRRGGEEQGEERGLRGRRGGEEATPQPEATPQGGGGGEPRARRQHQEETSPQPGPAPEAEPRERRGKRGVEGQPGGAQGEQPEGAKGRRGKAQPKEEPDNEAATPEEKRKKRNRDEPE